MNYTVFPKVPDSKELGKLAELPFSNSKPTSWWGQNIGGDSDFGLDFLIQFKDESNYIKYNFFLQLKGIKDKKKITENYIKVNLKSSTLNYYRNNGLVILVVCDLNTQNCYYEFLHTILNKLNENKRYLEDSQKTHLINIPKEQILNQDFNIEHILESYANGNYDIQRKCSIIDECNIIDTFNDNEEDYVYKRNIYQNHYIHQKGRVYVDAFIPSNFDFNISCLITFKLSDAKNALITPDEKTILKILFSGYKSKANSSSRKWIVCTYENDFIIQIGNTRLTVPPKTIIDLSDIFDDLFEIYTSRINEFENKLKVKSFPISKQYSNGFKLIKIKRGLWYHIHKFAEEYAFRDGNTEWNIFGYDNYNLRVNFKDKDFIWSGNIIIAPEVDSSYVDYKSYDDELVLVWNSLPNEKYERTDIDNIILNAEETHKWLINKLIPQVLYNIEKKNIKLTKFEQLFRIKKTLCFEQFISSYQSSKYIIWDYKHNIIEIDNKNIKNNLIYIVNKLQVFYRDQDSVFIDIDKLINLYEGIILLLKNTNYNNLSYIYGNLNDLKILGELNLNNFIKAIRNKIINLEEGTTNEFRIDLILRCYIVIIRDNINLFDDNLINNIHNKLDNIIKLMNLIEVRNRRLNSLSTL